MIGIAKSKEYLQYIIPTRKYYVDQITASTFLTALYRAQESGETLVYQTKLEGQNRVPWDRRVVRIDEDSVMHQK